MRAQGLVKNIKDTFNSLVRFLLSSKRIILLILITAIIILILSAAISIWLNRTIDLHLSSLVTIKTLGVEAYWDRSLENKTEIIDWGMIQPGSSKNITFYLQSISNVETTLYLNTTDWDPANISNYMSLSWNYNGTPLNPGEIIQVTMTLTASDSGFFILYLTDNNVEQFRFNIIIGTSKTKR